MRDNETAPTLIDPRGSGGPVALDGFDYQYFDGLIRIPGWLTSPVFEEMLFEGLEDFEARFFSPYAPQRRLLERFQAKSGDLSRSGVRNALEAFHEFEACYPHSARVQTLVTPRLPSGLGWLRRHPSRVRQARPFYEPFPDVVSASDEALKARCMDEFGDSLGPFVADFVEISERTLAGRDEAVGAFAGELHQAFPSLDLRLGATRSAFEALDALVRRTRGRPLPRSEIERVLQDVLDQELPLPGAFPLHVLSDRNEPNPATLQINATAFSGGAVAFPDPEAWASDLIEPIDHTASWLRGRGVSRVALSGSYRLTTAMALGWSLRSAHGFELDVPTRNGFWCTDDRPRTGERRPEWRIDEPEGVHGDQLAVSVGVLRDPSADLPHTARVPDRSALVFHLPTPLASASEAQASASVIKQAVDAAVARLQPRCLKVYMACPAAFAVVLGHRWNAMPRTHLHEYVARDSRYVETAVL